MFLKIERPHLLAVLFLAVCATGYLFDVLFLDRHLSAFDILLEKPSWKLEFGDIRANNGILVDSPTAHYPYKKEFWDATRQGYNAHYLPHIFTGKPTAGQGVGMLSTSPFQFFLDIPNALDWSTWFRLLLAAVFMYVFLIQLGVGITAAVLGSIAWTYNMHQIAWLMFPHHLATQLWLPLLLSLNLLLLKNRAEPTVALGLVFGVVFFFSSGYTQIVLYTFIYIGLFNVFYMLIVQRGPAVEKLKTWFHVQAIYVIAGLILLPDVLWQGQEIAEGLRGNQKFRYSSHELELSIASVGALLSDLLPSSIEAARLFLPNYESELGHPPSLKKFFNSNTVEYQVFFGLVCLYLCLYGLIGGVISRNRQLILFAVLLLLCIGLLNGNQTLIGLLGLVPFGGAGTYSRIATLILFTAAIFVAFGARQFVADLSGKRYFSMVFVVLLILGWLAMAKWKHQDTLALQEFVPWIGYLLAFVVTSAGLARLGHIRLVIPIAVIASFAELVLAGFNFNTRLEGKYHFPENSIIKQIRATDGYFRTALLMDNTAYHHNIFTYYDLSTIGGYSTVVPNDYVYFMREAYKKIHLSLNGIIFLFDGNLQILRLLNTRYIVSNLPLESDLISPVYSNDVETLYQFKEPLDRVYCASHQIVNNDPRSVPGHLAAMALRYDRPIIVENPVLDEESLTRLCKVSELEVFTSKLVFEVDSDRPSVVFIPVNHHMYWNARINGKTATVHKANYAFMSVVVPAGNSRVVLEFVNTKLVVGAVLFIVLGIIAIMIGWAHVHSRWQKTAILVCATVVIGKSLLSIPGIMNSDVPERRWPEKTQADQREGKHRLP